jgi:outer membrane immunogenic protein
MKKLLASTAVLVAFAAISPASAADMALKAVPAAAPAWSWAGPYIGGNVGYGWASDPSTLTGTTTTTQVRESDADTPTPTFTPLGTTTAVAAASGRVRPDGAVGGFQAGYNLQSNSFVYGLEGDIQISGQRGTNTLCITAGCPAGSGIATESVKLPWFGTFRGRIGFTPSPTWLVYATGGLAVTEVKEALSGGVVGGTPASLFGANMNTTRAGFAVGGGVETAIAAHWSLKVEYLYMGFGSVNIAGTGAPVTVTTGIAPPRILLLTTTTLAGAVSTRISDNVVRVGVNYHF